MSADLIHDRGRGPEIIGTRITVYNLLSDFLDAAKTEAEICRFYELQPEQVAVARAYVLNNAETVLAKHLEIEARFAAGNPPELNERLRETHSTLVKFKDWLVSREKADAENETTGQIAEGNANGSPPFLKFKSWLAEQASAPRAGS